MDQIRDWTCFDADSGKDLAVEVREYHIPDFSNWKNHDAFEAAFADLDRIAMTRVVKRSALYANPPLGPIAQHLEHRRLIGGRQLGQCGRQVVDEGEEGV